MYNNNSHIPSDLWLDFIFWLGGRIKIEIYITQSKMNINVHNLSLTMLTFRGQRNLESKQMTIFGLWAELGKW